MVGVIVWGELKVFFVFGVCVVIVLIDLILCVGILVSEKVMVCGLVVVFMSFMIRLLVVLLRVVMEMILGSGWCLFFRIFVLLRWMMILLLVILIVSLCYDFGLMWLGWLVVRDFWV